MKKNRRTASPIIVKSTIAPIGSSAALGRVSVVDEFFKVIIESAPRGNNTLALQ